MNLLKLITSSVTKISLENYQKSWKTLLKTDIHLLLWNIPFFIHWLNLLTPKILWLKEFVLSIYQSKKMIQHENWNLKFYLLKLLIQIMIICLQKQLIRMLKVKLNFGNTVVIVIKQITLSQIVFVHNAKMKKENKVLFLDRNHVRILFIKTSKLTRIEFIQMNNLYPTLWTVFQVIVMIHEVVQLQEIDIFHIALPVLYNL